MKSDTVFLSMVNRGNHILLFRFADHVSESYTEASKGNYQIQTGDETKMRLIDADALAAKIMMDAPDFMNDGSSITKAFILAMVNTRSVTPTIDAMQITRCKDCAFGNDFDIDVPPYVGYQCEKGYGSHTGDWYCGDGVKKND